jgi:hypothetical protein
MPVTYTPIATNTLTSASATVSFTSISQTYTDLVLVVQCGNSANAQSNIAVRVGNGSYDSGSNYSRTIIYGDGSSAISARTTNDTYLPIAAGAANNTVVGVNNIHFMNYSNTTTNKTFLSRGDQTSLYTVATVGLWRSTAAINQIQLLLATGGNFVAGSTFTLYGIKSA